MTVSYQKASSSPRVSNNNFPLFWSLTIAPEMMNFRKSCKQLFHDLITLQESEIRHWCYHIEHKQIGSRETQREEFKFHPEKTSHYLPGSEYK